MSLSYNSSSSAVRSYIASAITTSTGTISVTVSIGVAEGASPFGHWTDVLAISDAALYEAKAKGRNRVIAGEANQTS